MSENMAEQSLKGLHATLRWLPYPYEGSKENGWRREDGAGYVLLQDDGRWWVSWAHPMMCGGPGWHHHAFGTYVDATAGAMAFDLVYELERLAGNYDRCRELPRPAVSLDPPSPTAAEPQSKRKD